METSCSSRMRNQILGIWWINKPRHNTNVSNIQQSSRRMGSKRKRAGMQLQQLFGQQVGGELFLHGKSLESFSMIPKKRSSLQLDQSRSAGLEWMSGCSFEGKPGKERGIAHQLSISAGSEPVGLGMWLQGQKSFHHHSCHSRSKRRDLSTNQCLKKGAEGLWNNWPWLCQGFPSGSNRSSHGEGALYRGQAVELNPRIME